MVTVRRATDDDVAALQALAERALRATYTGVLVQADVPDLVAAGFVRAPIPEVVAADGVRVYLAVEAGDVVGYATVDDPAAVDVPELQVHVGPDRRDGDVGERLLDAVTGDLGDAGADRLRARVLAGDVAGNERLAERFERVETRETELGGELQAVVTYAWTREAG